MAHPKQLKKLSFLSLGFVAVLLAGCVSGKSATDAYTSRSGAVTTIESDRESCIRACNAEYERCGDMMSSTRSDVSSQPTIRPFGIKAECQDALKACLPRCKGR